MPQMLLKDHKSAIRASTMPPAWRLTGARISTSATTAAKMDIEILNGRIHHILSGNGYGYHTTPIVSNRAVPPIDLAGYLILPGLINAHDHLEFSLFPRLGHGPYQNFLEWAADIYHPSQSPVKEHLSIPKPARFWWGALRNLLCGVTTVCHHNPPIPGSLRARLPVRVTARYTWAHSLALGNDVANTFRSTPAKTPFIIHLAEGVDEQSRAEIFWLDHMRALRSNTVIVHGAGMDSAGHSLLERRRASLVWCPTSNQFLLGATLDLNALRRHHRVALASDSGLTAEGDLTDEIRFARGQTRATAQEVYAMVTDQAADVLRLTRGEGTLAEGAAADLIAVADDGARPCNTLSAMSLNKLELVMVDGAPKLLSPRLADRWPGATLAGLERIQVEGVDRLVAAPVRNLLKIARKHLGKEIRLGGKRIEHER